VVFDHTRPNGTSCFTALQEQGLDYHYAGENIAKGYSTPYAVVDAWMHSEGHRKNILNPDYTSLVVGIKENGWVQMFVG